MKSMIILAAVALSACSGSDDSVPQAVSSDETRALGEASEMLPSEPALPDQPNEAGPIKP